MQEMFDLHDPGHHRIAVPAVTPPDMTRAATPPPTAIVSEGSDARTDDSRLTTVRTRPANAVVNPSIEPGLPHGSLNRCRLTSAPDACLAGAAQYPETPP